MTSFAIGAVLAVVLIVVTGDATGRKALILPVPVAGLTRHIAMFPYQWEGCKTMIEARIAPPVGAVASPAICPKATTVIVIICMAGITICQRALVNPVCVAGSTVQLAMSACQREARVVMIEGRPTPTLRCVASATVCTELSIMRIPGRMTGVAIGGRSFENAVRVAGIASHIGMPPSQGEACAAVIEAYRAPPLGGVAGPTIRTELSAMRIIGSMAGITIRRRSFEDTVRMTRQTGNILMLSI